MKENEIIILQSEYEGLDIKEERNFPSKFQEDVKIILTTSIIASGINLLDDDYHSILIFDVNNFLEVFQLIGRPRKNKTIINVLDFISGLNDSEIINYADLLSERIRLYKDAELIFNTFYIHGYLKKSDAENFDKQIITGWKQVIPILYWDNDKFNTDISVLYNSIIEEVGKFSSEYPEIRKWIFEQLGVNATIEEFQEAPAVADRKAIKAERNKIESENLEAILGLLINNYDEVITYCNSKNSINKEIVPKLKYKLKESVESIEEHKQVLRIHKATINLYLLLKQYELPVENAMNFIKINFDQNNKLLRACEFICLSKSVKFKSPGEKKDRLFVTAIDNFVQKSKSKPITLEDFKEKINHFAGGSNLAKHFAAAPKICFEGVYEFKTYSGIKVKNQKNKSLYEMVWRPYNKKIDSIISYYKLDVVIKDSNDRTRRAFNKFIKNLYKFNVQ